MTKAQGMEVGAMLREGLGTEDIAIRLRVPPAEVRALVASLRAAGVLRAVLFGQRAGVRP